jgi:PRTRC genetic system protein A
MTDSLKNNPFVNMLCSYIVGPENIASDTKQFKFVMTGQGIKKVVRNRIGTFVLDTKEVPGLGELKTGVQLDVPRIPYELFQSMIQFFKRVMLEKGGAEAMLQFFYSPTESKYIAYCPKQTVSGGSVKFERNEEMESKYILVAEVHSHNSMSAFFSSIDNNDEKRTMIFGVVGKLNQPVFEYRFRMSLAGEYEELSIYDIFEAPAAGASFPEEWLENCQAAKSVTRTSTYMTRQDGSRYVYDDDLQEFVYIDSAGKKDKDADDEVVSLVRDSKYQEILRGKTDLNYDVPFGGLDVTSLSEADLDDIIRDILLYRLEDLAEIIVEENTFDELQTEIIKALAGKY